MKDAIEFWWSNHATRIAFFFYLCLLLLIPSQLGFHFWPEFTTLSGLRVDYLSPTLFFSDFFLVPLTVFLWHPLKSQLTIKRVLIVGSFVLYLSTIALLSQSPLNSLYGLMRWLSYSVFAFATWHFWQDRQFVKHSLLVLMLTICMVSVLAIWQFLEQHSIGGIFYWIGERSFSGQTPGIANASLNGTLVLRPYASFPHPNVLAGFLLVIGILLWGYKNVLDRTWQRYFFLGVFFLGMLAIGLSLSRTVILLFLTVSLAWIILGVRKTQITLKKISIGIVGFLLLLLPIIPRFAALIQSDEAVTLRLALLNASWEIFISSPLFGVGIKNFLPALSEGNTTILPYSLLQPVHNIFVLTLVEMGLLGLLWILPFFLSLVTRIRKSTSDRKWLKISLLLSLLGIGLVDHYFYTLHQGQLLLMLVLGVLWYTQPLGQRFEQPKETKYPKKLMS